MIKTFFFSLLLCLPFCLTAQECHVIAIDHFGGNKSDALSLPAYTCPDGSFQFYYETNSTTGSVQSNCGTPALYNHGGVLKHYDAGFNAIDSRCVPKAINFLHPARFVYPQANGDTIIIGVTTLDSGYDIGIERHDNTGAFLWNKRYGGSGGEIPIAVSQTSDSGFYVLGESNSSDGDVGLHYGDAFSNDFWVLRLDNNGNKVWGKVLGGSSGEAAGAIITAPDGGCYIFGGTFSNDYDISDNHGLQNVVAFQLDNSSAVKWEKCYGGSGVDGKLNPQAIKNGTGGFYIAASASSQDGDIQHRLPSGNDYWLLDIDSAGHLLRENTFGGGGTQIPYAMCQAKDGSIWIGGENFGSPSSPGSEQIGYYYGGNDVWVVHMDSMCNLINQIALGTNNDEYLTVLYPLNDGSVLAGGYYSMDVPVTKSSPKFPLTNEGDGDVFIAHLGAATEDIKTPDIIATDQWKLSPNPSKTSFQIEYSGNKSDVIQLSVADASGKIIYTSQFKNQVSVACEKWARGIYFVKITNKAGAFGVKRVVLE